jgi:hypothetical protein
MIGPFSFVHDSRTYNCYTERLDGEQSEMWWWFTVSHDGNRYAPFLALPRDTRASTQSRIVAYYANHLAHRQMTDQQHYRAGRRPVPAPAAAPKAAVDAKADKPAARPRGR